MAPSLSTMPAEILDMIFDKIDFVTIQIVRKVCRYLRNHIDHFPPDSKLINVGMLIRPNQPPNLAQDESISVMYFLKHRQRIDVEYQKNGKNGCRILYGNREKTIENEYLASVIGNDLGLILRNQTSEIRIIQLVFPTPLKLRLSEDCQETFHGRFIAALIPHMESRRTPILTKRIQVCGTNQESQISKILQFLDPGCLDSILIQFDKKFGSSSPTMKIDKLIGLDQWKQAKDIEIHGLSEELVKLRETIIHRSSLFKRLTINYRHLKDSKRFTPSIIGKPRSWEYTAWFNVPNNNEKALRIRWNPKEKWFCFECEDFISFLLLVARFWFCRTFRNFQINSFERVKTFRMAPSLSTMPAEILDMIFDNIDFVTIQIVRKVCLHLRNHIDHFPPDSKLVNITVKRPNLTQDEHISVMYHLGNKQQFNVEYQKNGKNVCRILYGNREKTIENQDFASVIGNDLGLILRNQNHTSAISCTPARQMF
ncbi:unnamed protein product [Caenorhabditis brenneri]